MTLEFNEMFYHNVYCKISQYQAELNEKRARFFVHNIYVVCRVEISKQSGTYSVSIRSGELN